MASAIDDTKPQAGNALTANVRANFTAAKDELNEWFRTSLDYATAAGSANTLTADFTNNVGLNDGALITVKAAFDNTGAATLNVDSTGAKAIQAGGSAIPAGAIKAGQFCAFQYDLANDVWELLNPLGVAAGNITVDGDLTVDGNLDVTGDITLENDEYIVAKETGGTARQVLGMTAANVVKVGDVNNVLETNSSSVPIAAYGGSSYEYITSEGGQTINGSVEAASFIKAIQTGASNLFVGERADSGDAQILIGNSNSGLGYVSRLTSTGNYLLGQTNDTGGSSENWIVCRRNAEVELYYNNSLKLETTSNGVDVTGRLAVDAVACTGNSQVVFDGARTGTASVQAKLRNAEGGLVLWADNGSARLYQSDAAGTIEQLWMNCDLNGGVDLFHNGSQKLEVLSTGINVTGSITADDTLSVSANSDNLGEFVRTTAGAANVSARNSEGGVLFRADGGNAWIYQTDSSGAVQDEWIFFDQNAGVTLKYNNATKLATTNTGVSVTGEITATGDITGNTSDIRTKTDIEDLTPEECYEAIKGKRVIRYRNNDINPDADTSKSQLGLVANEWEEDFPELTPLAPFDRDEAGNSKSGENYLTYKYERTVAILLGALQKAQQEIEELKSDVASLRSDQSK